MKCQVAWNWKAARTELVVTSQKRERLVLSEAEWLAEEPCPRLIPAFFDYAHVEEKRSVVRYNIIGTMKLSKLLKRRMLNTEQVSRLLMGLEQTVRTCANSSMLVEKILFHPDFVYLDEQQNPNFIFIPFANMAYDARLNSPFTMLSAMSDPRRMHWQSAAGELQRDAIQKFVHIEKIFSVNKFSKLLRDTLWGGVDIDALEEHDEPLVNEVPEHPVDPSAMFLGDLFAKDNVPSHPAQTFSIRRDDTGEVFVLPETGHTVTMGSSASCDYVVRNNDFMQEVHLRIRAEENCVSIEDCDSVYGTFAFNRRLAPHTPTPLYAGDKFLIGGEAFFICAYGSERASR